MATLERKHRGALKWWRDLFRAPAGRFAANTANDWMPWWWGAGISPEPMSGPFWVPSARRTPKHRHHLHSHRPLEHHPRHHA